MYNLLPFNYSRTENEEVLLVNECGDFAFVDNQSFEALIRHELDEQGEIFFNLKSKLFLAQDDLNISIQKLAARYRTRKSFLREFTSLHMMVITLRCNQRCEYCQVSCAEQDSYKYDMPSNIALKIIDIIFEAPTRNPKIEFQGGEPLLNWPVIESVVLYAEQKATQAAKEVSFVICTNLTCISKEQMLFCRDHNIVLSTSLDGTQIIHDHCRKFRANGNTYNTFIEKLEEARAILGEDNVDALMTTTAFSLEKMEDVVDEYVRLGINGIFIRSLNPYGFAAEKESVLGYSMEDFALHYASILNYIIKLNNKIFFPEHFATLLFSRILTPFSTGFVDLQSPSGAGISGAIYDFDGSVFPSDEARMLARMGDRHFCLGNVLHNNYYDIFCGTMQYGITEKACLETTFPCAWCVYQAYCGTDPVRNYLETGNEVRNMVDSPFCIKHKLIFDRLFSILRCASDKEQDIIWSWITKNPRLIQYHAHN